MSDGTEAKAPRTVHSGKLLAADYESKIWDERWCSLSNLALSLFADSGCSSEQLGHVELTSSSTAVSFANMDVWDDIATGRQFGFVLDPDPEAGDSRQQLYFDASDSESLHAWIDAIARVAKERGESSKRRGRRGAEEAAIDDFSDYEDESVDVVKRSSWSAKHAADWTAIRTADAPENEELVQPKKVEPIEVKEQPIDDFSDYEDDEIARKSSLCALDEQDWSKLAAMAPSTKSGE